MHICLIDHLCNLVRKTCKTLYMTINVSFTFRVCYEANGSNSLAIAFKDIDALVVMRESFGEDFGRVPDAYPELVRRRFHFDFHMKLSNI